MDHRQRFLQHLRSQRERLLEQIALFSSGQARLQEQRGGAFVDTTEELIVRLYRELGELGTIAQEAALPPDPAG